MPSAEKTVKLCIILTDIFLVVLAFIVVLLPLGVSWYVDVMQRPESLPATIMITCYPCAPFLGIALFSLRKILKQVYSGNIFTHDNSHRIKVISLCCLVIAVITLIAGRFYLPFFIVAGTFTFLSLIAYSIRAVFLKVNELNKDKN